MLKKGLNGFQIKIIGIILMTMDHIHYVFSELLSVPIWFTMLGRVAAPLFFFMTANGMRHTRSREKYLLRLYIGAVFMGAANMFLNIYYPHPSGIVMMGNIFSTLFIFCLLIYSGENIVKYRRLGQYKKMIFNVVLFLIPILSSIPMMIALSSESPMALSVMRFFMIMIPNVLVTEGGFMMVIMGLGFYIFSESKFKFSIFYLIYCLFIAYSSFNPAVGISSLMMNFQWMMIGSLPIILLYNKERGPSWKYLFYIYYPVHLIGFLFIARFIAKV